MRLLALLALLRATKSDRLTEEGLELRLAAKETRCVWDELAEGQGATLEVFVLSGGGSADVQVSVDGPFPMADGSRLPKAASPKRGVPPAFDKPVARLGVKAAVAEGDQFATPTAVAIPAPSSGAGAFKFCFDNGAARLSERVVAVTMRKAPMGPDALFAPLKTVPAEGRTGRNAEAVDKVEKRVVALRAQLAGLKDKQSRERRRLARHKALYDSKHDSMVEASLVETFVYILCACVQIWMVRRWFAGRGVMPVFMPSGKGDHAA